MKIPRNEEHQRAIKMQVKIGETHQNNQKTTKMQPNDNLKRKRKGMLKRKKKLK